MALLADTSLRRKDETAPTSERQAVEIMVGVLVEVSMTEVGAVTGSSSPLVDKAVAVANYAAAARHTRAAVPRTDQRWRLASYPRVSGACPQLETAATL